MDSRRDSPSGHWGTRAGTGYAAVAALAVAACAIVASTSGGPAAGSATGQPTAGATAPSPGQGTPVDTAGPAVALEEQYQSVVKAALGIQARDAVSASGEPGGVAITSVTPGGPADSAGLQAGDVIIEINGAQVPDLAALSAELANLKPAEKVTVKYVRGGTVDSAKVTLGTLKST